MDLNKIKSEINLIDFARKNYGIECNSKGRTLCPFHEEKNPSFEIKQYNGFWGWRDWHLSKEEPGFSGTIVDLVMRLENLSFQGACKKLKDMLPEIEVTMKKNKEMKYYQYHDLRGSVVFRKAKQIFDDGTKRFWIELKDKNGWRNPTLNERYKKYPYHAHWFKDYKKLIICEGEKDADAVNELNTEYLATSAPFGCKSWPEDMNTCFVHISDCYFLYDIGNEGDAKRHAAKLQGDHPHIKIYIAKIPLKEREADISDYLNSTYLNFEEKKHKLMEILNKSEKYKLDLLTEDKKRGIFIGSLEDFMSLAIPKEERLIDPIVFRGGLTEIGGVKGSHKSFFIILLSLHLASGNSPFLKFIVEKPARVLLIQQEVSLGFMQERLKKIMINKEFYTEGRFYPATTTAEQLKLTDKKHFDQIKKMIETHRPDVLGLDPLSSFNTSEENMSKDMSRIVARLSELKSQYNLGIVLTHHFSSKVNPNDSNAPIEAGGWFRGHTTLTDAADVLICLHRLPGQRENPNLPKDYEDYNLVQVELRNGRWPGKFAVEFDEDTFLLKESTIWEDIGKKIFPEQIEELVISNGREMMLKDVIDHFKSIARPTTVRRAIDETVRKGTIEKVPLPNKGNPILLKSLK